MRKYYPYADETNDLTIVTKVLGLYNIHDGILLLMWWFSRNIDRSKTP